MDHTSASSALNLCPPNHSQVYSWFLGTHKVSVTAGMAGYALVVVEMTGLGELLRPVLRPATCLTVLWYGLYFGILGRDAAEVAADRMVRLLEEEVQGPESRKCHKSGCLCWGHHSCAWVCDA